MRLLNRDLEGGRGKNCRMSGHSREAQELFEREQPKRARQLPTPEEGQGELSAPTLRTSGLATDLTIADSRAAEAATELHDYLANCWS